MMHSRKYMFAGVATFIVFSLSTCFLDILGGHLIAPTAKNDGVQAATKNVPSTQEKILLSPRGKDQQLDSRKVPAAPRPDVYLGVSIDFLDPIEIASIREEVLLDIELAESMKALERDFFKQDEKTVTTFVRNIFSLPEVIASVAEYNQIRSEYGKTNDNLRKKELIERMKVSRSRAARIVDSAILREKLRSEPPAPATNNGEVKSVIEGSPSIPTQPKTFQ